MSVHLTCIARKERLKASGRQGSDGDELIARAGSDTSLAVSVWTNYRATQQVVEPVFG
jgi:hypothetical protein